MQYTKSERKIKIAVQNLRLSNYRSRPGYTAAYADLNITGLDGRVRSWKNTRLVFVNFWPVDFPIGYYQLYTEGEYRGGHRQGTRLIPHRWRRQAEDAVWEAAFEAQEEMKARHAAEIAAGTRWAPLPLEKLRPCDPYACGGEVSR